ncbi:hypothetical protein ACHAO7_008135 [Fusarium culmorum]
MNSVATSLPTISEALGAGPTVTWVGTSYLLGQLSFQPLYGRISDITGRKPVLLFSMGCIVVGGILCGFARTPVWFLAVGTGAASGPFVAAGLIQMSTNGWRWAFWVPAIMGAVCFVLLVFPLPPKPVSGSLKEKVQKID